MFLSGSGTHQYILIEYGFTLTLASDSPTTHPYKHWPASSGDGRTFTTPLNGNYNVFPPGTYQ